MVMDENVHSNILDPMAMLLDAKLENIAAFDASAARKLQQTYAADAVVQEDLRVALLIQSEEDSALACSEDLEQEDFRVANETQEEIIRAIKKQEEEDLKVASQAQEEEEKAAMEMKQQLSKDEEIAKALHEDFVKNVHAVILKGDVAALQALIDKGLDCSITSCQGTQSSPLQIAIRAQQMEICKILVGKGAAIDRQDATGNTALHTAIECNKVAFIKFLLQSNAKVDVRNKLGQTALTIAAKGGHSEAVDLLLEKGAYIYHKDGQNKMPMQHVPFLSRSLKSKLESMMGWSLLEAARKGRGDKVMNLMDRGASVFLSDECNRTALHHAAQAGHNMVVEYLLQQKADPNAADTDEQTPLHKAAAAGAVNVYQTLLRFGARPDRADNKGRLPLQLCANAGKASQLQEAENALKTP